MMTSTQISQSSLDFKSKSHSIHRLHSMAANNSSSGTVAKLVAESLMA
jgi:hypothetical protein